MNWPFSSTPRKAASSLGISGSYSARTSTSGIAMRRHFSLRPPPIDEIRREEDDPGHHGVLDVTEVVVKARVARSEPVADSDEREGPDRRPDRRESRELRKWHLEDPRRDGDERADDRRHRAEKDSRPVPAVEPPRRAVETLGRDVEPAAAPSEQLPATETS